MRYQIIDPNFSGTHLGGMPVTVIDDISIVNLSLKEASYWITQGAVLPLSPVGQINYQLGSPDLTSEAVIFDLPLAFAPIVPPDFASSRPAMGVASIYQVHALFLNNVFSVSSPSIASPPLIQAHGLGGLDLGIGSVSIDLPIFHQPMIPPDLVCDSPSIDDPDLVQVIGIVVNGISVASPVISTATIGQINHLAGVNLNVSSITMGAVVLHEPMIPPNLICSSPTMTMPVLGQIPNLVAAGISTASPVIDNSAIVPFIWLPVLNGQVPVIFANFAAGNYWFNNTAYSSLANWITAVGGTESRTTPSTYLSNGSVLTAAANVPRFPTDIVGQPTGLRLTGPRQNLLTQSQDFSNASWIKFGSAVATPNVSTAPDGTNTANTLIPATTSGTPYVRNYTSPATANMPYVLSCFFKPSGYNWAFAAFYDGSAPVAQMAAMLNMTTGVVTLGTPGNGGNPSNTPITGQAIQLANGWWWFAISVNKNASSGTLYGYLGVSNTGTFSSALPAPFVGDGVSGIYMWGAEMTQSAFLEDYVPTTTAVVTHAADVLYVPTSTWLAASGTWAASGVAAVNGVNQNILSLNDSAGNYTVGAASSLRLGVSGNNSSSYGGSSSVAAIAAGGSPINAYKLAGIYDIPSQLQRVVDANGATSENNTLDYTGVGASRLVMGSLRTTTPTQQFYGDMKSIAYWPQAASVPQAQKMLGTML